MGQGPWESPPHTPGELRSPLPLSPAFKPAQLAWERTPELPIVCLGTVPHGRRGTSGARNSNKAPSRLAGLLTLAEAKDRRGRDPIAERLTALVRAGLDLDAGVQSVAALGTGQGRYRRQYD
jgi:hypothetical protein